MRQRLIARRAGQRFLIEGAPGHDMRRSAFALWRVAVGTVAPLLAAVAFVQGLRWSGLLPERWTDLLEAVVAAAGFGGYVAAVAGALTMRSQPSWRIASIDDDAAARLRPLGWILTALAVVGIMWDAFNRTVGASTPALVATQATEALLHVLLIGGALTIVGRLRASRASLGGAEQVHVGGAGVGLLVLVGWIAVATALVSLLIGFIGFSLFLVQVVVWGMILSASLYLLMTAVDDLATSVFVRDSRLASTLTGALGIRASAIDQFGVLLSAVLRIALLLLGFGLLLSPFGAGGGPMAIFGRLGTLSQGVEVGGVAISPGAVLRGIAVLLIGLALVRLFMNWLERRYLPITDLDGSGRNSVSLVARYVGIAIASIWALASLGIGVERIALLLSALSVGIGFGLQAITQNFVSGLILLAERPIKIGDLVRVGNDEGDVRRISVRSTEIELADHSTLIVPNSELITKSVLNKTLAGPRGRIQIQFSVPLGADAEQARTLALAAFAGVPGVLDDPAPVAFVDSIADGRVLFNCFGHVASPRAAYPMRSAVLLALLRDLRAARIELGAVPQRLELVRDPDRVHAP
ncbi:mechanosensitive ion channel family protein [Sphingomonas bacterium]|uniref:mechanosensitive ion channel family protein n=1 Tax=Sphingomonas bacterium TaxID=1895847 RepID=UPI0034A07478